MGQKGNLLLVVLFIVVGLGIGSLMVLYPKTTTTPTLPPASAASDTGSSGALNVPGTPKESEVFNSDESLKLIMQKGSQAAGSTDYVFYVAGGDGSNKRLLWAKTMGQGQSLSLPGTSWSPDYKEIFVEADGPGTLTYFVLKVGGETYAADEKYLDVAALFAKTNSPYRFQGVTGWDGYGLLHVTTALESGGGGPKFWFVTGTKQFLQLARAPNE